MPNKFIFADEAGCFTFNRQPNVSKYFIPCTIIMDDCSVGADLLDLRPELAWRGMELTRPELPTRSRRVSTSPLTRDVSERVAAFVKAIRARLRRRVSYGGE